MSLKYEPSSERVFPGLDDTEWYFFRPWWHEMVCFQALMTRKGVFSGLDDTKRCVFRFWWCSSRRVLASRPSIKSCLSRPWWHEIVSLQALMTRNRVFGGLDDTKSCVFRPWRHEMVYFQVLMVLFTPSAGITSILTVEADFNTDFQVLMTRNRVFSGLDNTKSCVFRF